MLMKKVLMYFILLFISFIGGIIPWIMDQMLFVSMDFSVMPYHQFVYLVSILWGVFVQIVIYFVGRKMNLFLAKRYKIITLMGFFCVSVATYVASWFIAFAVIFAWTISQI